jgi:hypothetical protein
MLLASWSHLEYGNKPGVVLGPCSSPRASKTGVGNAPGSTFTPSLPVHDVQPDWDHAHIPPCRSSLVFFVRTSCSLVRSPCCPRICAPQLNFWTKSYFRVGALSRLPYFSPFTQYWILSVCCSTSYFHWFWVIITFVYYNIAGVTAFLMDWKNISDKMLQI